MNIFQHDDSDIWNEGGYQYQDALSGALDIFTGKLDCFIESGKVWYPLMKIVKKIGLSETDLYWAMRIGVYGNGLKLRGERLYICCDFLFQILFASGTDDAYTFRQEYRYLDCGRKLPLPDDFIVNIGEMLKQDPEMQKSWYTSLLNMDMLDLAIKPEDDEISQIDFVDDDDLVDETTRLEEEYPMSSGYEDTYIYE